MKLDLKYISLTMLEYLCIAAILFTGNILPLSSVNIVILVLSVSFGVWYLWTVKFKRFNLTIYFPKNARIVPVGPYKYVRHPVYLTILLVTGVVVLEHYTLIRISAWLLLLVVLLIKIMVEERIISRRNTDYLIYKRSTKMLVPFLY